MMFKENFVVAIRVNGEVLREVRESGPTVYLPFESEYEIRLKNNNGRRAKADVFIDGVPAIKGVVIPANGTIDLERFLLDGDLSSGKKFKFVRADHPDVQDPTSGENGLVRVEFELEKTQEYVHVPYDYNPFEIKFETGINPLANMPVCCCSNSSAIYTANVNYRVGLSNNNPSYMMNVGGATVEGGISNQKFTQTYFNTDPATKVIIELKLKPKQAALTVKSSKYVFCPSCGGKVKFWANYCQHCGVNLKSAILKEV